MVTKMEEHSLKIGVEKLDYEVERYYQQIVRIKVRGYERDDGSHDLIGPQKERVLDALEEKHRVPRENIEILK